MKKYIILSVNDNIDYLFYVPLIVWAWRKFGWEPILMKFGSDQVLINGPYTTLPVNTWPKIYHLDFIPWTYRPETYTQISRLYAGCIPEFKDGYLMTSDIDMLPLSDYWKFDETAITVWGHDLTGFTHYPICYIGMSAKRWIEVMGLNSTDYNALIKRDLDAMPKAKSKEFQDYWFCDQELITKRINETEFPVHHIERGTFPSGHAINRVDRGSWSLDHAKFIDCHMFRDIFKPTDQGYQNYARTIRLLERVWPGEDFKWFETYVKEFRKLV